jgi:hypothetical protein
MRIQEFDVLPAKHCDNDLLNTSVSSFYSLYTIKNGSFATAVRAAAVRAAVVRAAMVRAAVFSIKLATSGEKEIKQKFKGCRIDPSMDLYNSFFTCGEAMCPVMLPNFFGGVVNYLL